MRRLIARRFRYRQRQIIRRHGNRFSMEVTAGDHLPARIKTSGLSIPRGLSQYLFRLT